MYREDDEALQLRERELLTERDALAERVRALEASVPRPPRAPWVRMLRRKLWLGLWPALVVLGLLVAYFVMALPPPSRAVACANGDASACRGVSRVGDERWALLDACAGGDKAACDVVDADPAKRGPALRRLCELGVVADCRAAAELATGASAADDLRLGCVLEDAAACQALAHKVDAGDGTLADPLEAIGLLRSACLLDAATCLEYGDRAARDGKAEIAANAWTRACDAGVSDACGRSR